MADDITAEVFVKAIAAVRADKGAHSHIRGWLFRIAHNLVIDYYRARERAPGDRRQDVGLDDVLPKASQEPTLYEEFEAAERLAWLSRAIERLTDAEAEVIRLRNADYSHEEIAALTGRTFGAVKATQQRARANLEKMTEMARRE